MKRVDVFGLGHVGLPVSAVPASRGSQVVGAGVNRAVISTISETHTHKLEFQLNMLLQAAG